MKRIWEIEYQGGEGDILGITQETEGWPDWQMAFAQTRICSKKWNA